MKERSHFKQADEIISNNLRLVKSVTLFKIFSKGGCWMAEQMGIENLDDKTKRDFNIYGIIKYGLSITVAVLVLILMFPLHIPFAIMLAILAFYIVEVHFLFLFPLLIDRVKSPFVTSIKITYSLGFIECLIFTMVIAIYMIVGLFNTFYPLKNWYTGCLVIVLWYQDEVRDRI